MVHVAIAEAQSRTLAEWAQLWEQEAAVSGGPGAEAVARLLRRAARSVAARQDVGLADDEREPVLADSLRDG